MITDTNSPDKSKIVNTKDMKCTIKEHTKCVRNAMCTDTDTDTDILYRQYILYLCTYLKNH